MRFPQGVLATCVVPWDEREQLLDPQFRTLIRRLRHHGFTNLYIFGTAGEGHAVDAARFRDVATVFREETRDPAIAAQVGAIGLSTANVVERIAIAHDLGFRLFQVSLPSWGVLNDGEVMRFFRDVCGTFPDSRFVHYNLARAGRLLEGRHYRRIADEVPNLVATKITGTDQNLARDVMEQAPELQHFFVQMFPFAIRLGACSLLASLGPLCPARTHELFRCAISGDWEHMDSLWSAMQEMFHQVVAPARGGTLMDGAWDKLLTRLGGFHDFPLRLLSPYDTFPEETARACEIILQKRFAEWTQ